MSLHPAGHPKETPAAPASAKAGLQPTLFISHGAPTFVIDPELPGDRLAEWARTLPRPKAILVVSAHWGTEAPAVSIAAQPETIHDFHGFPPELYEMTYPAPGAPALAARVAELLEGAGIPTARTTYGLDHGAWVPLKLMFPEAKIPVTQLALQPRKDPAHHFRLGEALLPLREEGVLIIGSGQVTHNLRELSWGAPKGEAMPWAAAFAEWVHLRLMARDWPTLLAYRRQAPYAERAHPTDEHFLPLFVALGALGEMPNVQRWPLGMVFGTLLMDSYRFD
jgi:4,5-DOPA dioxygenase extradiol